MKTVTFALTAVLFGVSAITATAATATHETNARIERDRMNDAQWSAVVRGCLAAAQPDMGYCRAVIEVNFDNGDGARNG